MMNKNIPVKWSSSSLAIVFAMLVLSILLSFAPLTPAPSDIKQLMFLPESHQKIPNSAEEAWKQLDAFIAIPADGLEMRRNRQDVWIFVPPLPHAPLDRALLYLDFVRLDYAQIFSISTNTPKLIGETGVSVPRHERMIPQLRFPHLMLAADHAEQGYLVRLQNDLPVKFKIELQTDSIKARQHETLDNLYIGALVGFGLLAVSIAACILFLHTDRLNILYFLGIVFAFIFLAHYNRLTEFWGIDFSGYWVNIFDAILAGCSIAVATLLMVTMIPRRARSVPISFTVYVAAGFAAVLPVTYTFFSGRNPANVLGLLFGCNLLLCLWLWSTSKRFGLLPVSVSFVAIAPLVVGAVIATLRDAGVLSNEVMLVKGAVELGLCVHVALTLTLLFNRAISKHALYAATRAREMRDPLTGLPDEHGLLQSLAHTVRRSARYGHAFGVLQIRCRLRQDTAEFSSERSTILIASTIAEANGEYGYLARCDNGDFSIIVEGFSSQANIQETATRILASLLRLEVNHEGYKHAVSTKIVWTASSRDEFSENHLLQSLTDFLDRWIGDSTKKILEMKYESYAETLEFISDETNHHG